MAEALVAGVLTQLTKFISDNIQRELKLLTGVKKEAKSLANNLEAIQALLRDAEEKQLNSQSIQLWLERLKEAAYDMEDELDEWNTRLLKYSHNASLLKRKVLSLIPCFPFCQPVSRHRIAVRIKEINDELDEIAKAKNRYQLTAIETRQPKLMETVSFVDVSTLFGRDKDKENLKITLLSNQYQTSEAGDVIQPTIQTISVVGMGGIGKTTLAQLVYNDDEVQAHFNERIWVCVSNVFNQTKVARDILIALEKQHTNPMYTNAMYLLDSVPLQSCLETIHKKIEGKKFLLVLDDVWTEHDEDWQPIKAALKYGMAGSRILVTTRKTSVAEKMKSSYIFHLEKLSDLGCWLIIREVAFHERNRKEFASLENIGREIAKKCKGLPLVAKTLGGVLQGRRTREEWENILFNDIWNLNLAQEYVFNALLLSYRDLPSTIKPCLLYCSLFQKDKELDRQYLIYSWSSQGYLDPNGNSETESTGEEYLNLLVARSFLQDVTKGQDLRTFKMHDIIHDFLLFLTRNEIVMEEVKTLDERVDISSKKPRHLHLRFLIESDFPKSIYGAKKLRSLVISGEKCVCTEQGLGNFFSESKCLRSLIFPSMSNDLSINIPKEIGKLIHLRFPVLSFGKIRRLPETIGELYNLRYLDLGYCRSLEKLPDSMMKLINLRFVDTLGCYRLTYYPKAIGRLTSLTSVWGIIVRADGNHPKEFSVSDFENLNDLKNLMMELVGNVIDEGEAQRAKFQNKKHLESMVITAKRIQKNDAIKALNPPPNVSVSYFEDQKSYVEKLLEEQAESGGWTEEELVRKKGLFTQLHYGNLD